MTGEDIPAEIFIREYTKELHNRNAVVFAGAGLSMASGYVDWRSLLRQIVIDLGLNPDKDHDLVTIAQYHCNRSGGKGHLTQTIFDNFSVTKSPTQNHRILASLPILTYWTTNYDKLIEKALEEAKKVPDTKYTLKQLAVTRLDRDVVIYKMHGDIDHPAEAVITKDDYESYSLKMSAYVSALRGDLIEKTFLFLGFSFTDPNIDYILGRVRSQYEQHQRHHYSIQKKVFRSSDETIEEFNHRELMQHYFIRDLKRFGIQTVLVSDYSDITKLLEKVAARYKRSSVFISGAADSYGNWTPQESLAFVHKLAYKIASQKNRIITGFGLGIGGAVINGALAYLTDCGKTISDEEIVMRPFPQVMTGTLDISQERTQYRKAMIDYAGIAIFVFGNKRDASGGLTLSTGMKEEFELCIEAGVKPIPVGSTGFMAAELWAEVSSNFSAYFPEAEDSFRLDFHKLGDPVKRPEDLLPIIESLVRMLQKG